MRVFPFLLVIACSGRDILYDLGGAGAPPPEPTPSAPVRMRVMTYNVNFGLAGDREGVAAVASASPDIVLLQETNDAWADAFVRGLATRFPHHRFAPPHDWPAGGMGVLSRWPITRIDELPPPPGEPFFAWRIVIAAPGGPVQLLDVHLRPPMSDDGSWVKGYFTTRGDREREAKAHAAALDPTLPTIIAGDFNEEDDGLAHAVFRGRGFADALAQFHPDALTWHWPVGGITLRFRLDHIMVDARFRVLDAAVVEGGRSDHQPVWADVTSSASAPTAR